MRWELFYFNREWTKSWTQLTTNLFGQEEKKACKVQMSHDGLKSLLLEVPGIPHYHSAFTLIIIMTEYTTG